MVVTATGNDTDRPHPGASTVVMRTKELYWTGLIVHGGSIIDVEIKLPHTHTQYSGQNLMRACKRIFDARPRP